MTPLLRLISAALGLLMFAGQAVSQETPVAAAADADVIAIYTRQIEKRLLRAHFDRAANKISLVPFGPPGVENFAVAPNGAFVVFSSTRDDGAGGSITRLSLIDEAGHALGEPVRSPVGAVTRLAVSPKGDRIAASSDRGWIALLAVEGTGPARRLVTRIAFGVTPDRQFTFAFRPTGELVTVVDDWVATYRSNDGAIQRTLDLKTLNRDLTPADQDIGSLFQLTWSPRGDSFAISWGPGPMMTTLFDAAGRRLRPSGAENGLDLGASKVAFVDGGDAMIVYGMQAPLLVRMKSLGSTAFADPAVSVDWCGPLAGGREIALVAGDRVAVWSLQGKRLTEPVALENYALGAAAAGAKDDLIVAAERAGWVELYTKAGKFIRRVQTGGRDRIGFVALSADGSALAAGGEPLIAVAANGSRIVMEGPDKTLRSSSAVGAEGDVISLKAGEQTPGRRLSGLAVSRNGDAIAAAEEGSAVWLAYPADKRVVRVDLAARSVAPLPDGAGFAIGLADGTVARLSRDGSVEKLPFKASQLGAVGRIVVAPDGESFIAVEDDESHAGHFAWDGRVMAGPYRAGQSETIRGAFFREGAPRLIIRTMASAVDEYYAIVPLGPPAERQVIPLDRPR